MSFLWDDICGPGATWFPAASGPGDCLPDSTTGPPVPPPLDPNQWLYPTQPIKVAPPSSGGVNPSAPFGVPLTPPPASPLGGSNTTMLLLLGAGVLLMLTMGKGRR